MRIDNIRLNCKHVMYRKGKETFSTLPLFYWKKNIGAAFFFLLFSSLHCKRKPLVETGGV